MEEKYHWGILVTRIAIEDLDSIGLGSVNLSYRHVLGKIATLGLHI